MNGTSAPTVWIIDTDTERIRPLSAVVAEQAHGDLTYDPETGNGYETRLELGRKRWYLPSNGIPTAAAYASGPAVTV